MDKAIVIRDLTFRYDDQSPPVFSNLNLEIEEGQSVAVMGANGSGKSTLAYVLSGIIPRLVKGRFTGSVTVFGHGPQDCESLGAFSKDIAFLFQNPEDQFLSFTVGDEFDLASPEALGLNLELEPVVEFLSRFHCAGLLRKSPKEMSMGEVQRVSILAAAYQKPKLIILDEPTTALDYRGLSLVTQVLKELPSTTKIINSHNFQWAKRTCDRILGVKDGVLLFDLPSDRVSKHDFLALFEDGPANQKENALSSLISFLEEYDGIKRMDAGIRADSISYSYPRSVQRILNKVSFETQPGEVTSIIGPNGSGKTTMLLVVGGLLRPKEGHVYYNNIPMKCVRRERRMRISVMLQNPSYQLVTDSIREELCLSLRQISADSSFIQRALKIIRNVLGLDDLDQNPRSLSFGWQKILSLVCCLCLNPAAHFLDEPELGLDPAHRKLASWVVRGAGASGKPVVMTCHDPDFVREVTSNGLLLGDTRAEFYGTGAELLENYHRDE